MFTNLRWPFSPRRRLLNRVPRGAVCAEIGVWKGDFSARILRHTRPRALHLIDPWLFQPDCPEHPYGGRVAGNQADMDRIHQAVEERFGNAPGVVIHRGASADILSTFPDDHFDWVYIDGDHAYDFVLADLHLCFAKTKPGGLITGDDYTRGSGQGYPIARAVRAFTKERGIGNWRTLDSQFLIDVPRR